ncbi:serine/threonine-protein kinase 17B [Lates japonicus]|uniref:Serine/threonine-protein kinase 17B n=1 Tax=Lates japonicus TaxID=270547 RepID=A0AAD3MCN0_LATJO|nr:serine/threonine-protein kinase 17B [Lates japonicus]
MCRGRVKVTLLTTAGSVPELGCDLNCSAFVTGGRLPNQPTHHAPPSIPFSGSSRSRGTTQCPWRRQFIRSEESMGWLVSSDVTPAMLLSLFEEEDSHTRLRYLHPGYCISSPQSSLPQNILLTSLSPPGDIKIVDFGLARRLGAVGELREILGTPEYVAPEILNYEPITTATDLWSVGVIAYMLVTGESPFAGDDKQETYLNVSQVNVDYSREAFSRVSELAVDFIRKLLIKAPEDRPSAAECMSHPWLWQQQQICLSPDPTTTRPFRERSCGTKWAAPPEDPEDKENFLESPHSHAKRFRFDEETSAPGDGDF